MSFRLGSGDKYFYLKDTFGIRDAAICQEKYFTFTEHFTVADAPPTRIFFYKDGIDISDDLEYREIEIPEIINFQENKSLTYTNAQEIIESYFPDYFYQEEPYKNLIDALADKAGFNYAIAENIPYVYNIDRISPDRKNYNSLLRLVGINYDFNDYPIYMLKTLLRNYLSIRKHRGTKSSILAMLRSMDEKFIKDANNRCPIEIEPISNYVLDNQQTIDKAGVLEIFYENIPPKFFDHVYYMLGKVIPTGIYYKLAHKKIHVTENLTIFDRGYKEDSNLYLKYLKDRWFFNEKIAERYVEKKEQWELIDQRGTPQQEIEYFTERITIEIHVQDTMYSSGGFEPMTIFVSESMSFNDDDKEKHLNDTIFFDDIVRIEQRVSDTFDSDATRTLT